MGAPSRPAHAAPMPSSPWKPKCYAATAFRTSCLLQPPCPNPLISVRSCAHGACMTARFRTLRPPAVAAAAGARVKGACPAVESPSHNSTAATATGFAHACRARRALQTPSNLQLALRPARRPFRTPSACFCRGCVPARGPCNPRNAPISGSKVDGRTLQGARRVCAGVEAHGRRAGARARYAAARISRRGFCCYWASGEGPPSARPCLLISPRCPLRRSARAWLGCAGSGRPL